MTNDKKIRILFISRAYPPVVGGIENQNFELGSWLSKIAQVKIIANKRGKFFLPFFIPYSIIRALFLLPKYDGILLGDGVMSLVGWKLKFLTKKPVICVVHGLDITYKNWLFQTFWVGLFLKKMDRLIAVGNETIRAGVKRGIPEEKFAFIPNGVDIEKCRGNFGRDDLQKILKDNLGNKKVILTSGRLIKRKGVAWFIREVMPKLPVNFIYVIAGAGSDWDNISKAIAEKGLADRIEMLGYVSDETRNVLFNTCDVFVQPNIKIPGDMEGFGISVIEAGACGLPVLASRLEGLQDAIKDGQNGYLLPSGDCNVWAEKVEEILRDDEERKAFGQKVGNFVKENYSWGKISENYLDEINKLIVS